jgi:hypothetical protein
VEAEDTRDFAVCGLTRSRCEWLCSWIGECTGFDMHKTLERCWLNTGACGASEIEAAEDHDLVTVETAAACEVEISGAGAADGTYVQESAYVFNSVPPNGHYLEYGTADEDACFWSVKDVDAGGRAYVITNDSRIDCTEPFYSFASKKQ